MSYSCGHKPYAGVCCVECRPDLFFNAAGFPTAYSPAPTLTPYAPDPRDARIAELEAQLVTATEKGLELAKLLDPAVVWAATQLKANADAHPGGCCVKCRAALAENARLEALIVAWWEKQGGAPADALCGEALRVIRSRP